MRLNGKVALITGSSKGIGLEIARLFLKEGASVVVCGSKLETAIQGYDDLKREYDEEKILPIGVNLSSDEEVENMVKTIINRFGCIDVLINNAGITSVSSIEDTSIKDFEKMMEINVIGAFRCIKAVSKVMEEKGGSIINTSSLVAKNGSANQSAYVTSKYAIEGLTKAASRELGKFNIRVNAVAPGVVGTKMVSENVTDEMKNILNKMTPLGRMANPKELAGAYLYLASDESSFTTGTTIEVNGGLVK